MKAPSVVVGLDQTGAARRQGRAARPLPTVVARREAGAWTLTVPEPLPALTPAALAAAGVPLEPSTWIVADAVVGLPQGIRPGLEGPERVWTLARAAASWTWEGRSFGRETAARFVAGWAGARRDAREVDRRTGALTVLAHTPYQRNVQTGSYRVWRDLGQEGAPWLNLWPFQTEATVQGPWLFEGWPTWGWKQLWAEPVRAPKRTATHLLAAGWQVSEADALRLSADADLADAAVAAAIGVHVAECGVGAAPEVARRWEGWILGVPA